MSDTLQTLRPVVIDQTVHKNPQNLSLANYVLFPVEVPFGYFSIYPAQTDELYCRARAGDVWFVIQVMPAQEPSANDRSMKKFFGPFSASPETLGIKIVTTAEDGITCRESLGPSRDHFWSSGRNEVGIDSVGCSGIQGGLRVTIAAIPRIGTKNPPVSVVKLRLLTKQAASQL